ERRDVQLLPRVQIGPDHDRDLGVELQEITPSRHSGMVRRTRPGISRFRVRSFYSRPGMTARLSPGVAGPGADDAFLAAELVALAGRGIEGRGNLRLHRIAVRAAGILHVDRERSAGALHGDGGALALALLQRGD